MAKFDSKTYCQRQLQRFASTEKQWKRVSAKEKMFRYHLKFKKCLLTDFLRNAGDGLHRIWKTDLSYPLFILGVQNGYCNLGVSHQYLLWAKEALGSPFPPNLRYKSLVIGIFVFFAERSDYFYLGGLQQWNLGSVSCFLGCPPSWVKSGSNDNVFNPKDEP